MALLSACCHWETVGRRLQSPQDVAVIATSRLLTSLLSAPCKQVSDKDRFPDKEEGVGGWHPARLIILLVAYAAAVLASQTEAFISIFTHSELQRIQLTAPAQIGARMTSRHLEKYQAAREGLLREALPLDPLGKHRRVVSLWLGPGGPPPTLALRF
ncbi:promotilin [Meriones unguiculatus]|uniref:promotilin n=1 Tax=Meriones unguiculatus TaxID=10047 RepID=UPI00293F031F|nr:promotilin [Meriones unguiculatus]